MFAMLEVQRKTTLLAVKTQPDEKINLRNWTISIEPGKALIVMMDFY